MVVLLVRVSMYLFGLTLWMHASGSAWYWVGLAEEGWAVLHDLEDRWPLNYLVSVHWASSQLQGGNTNIMPGDSNVEWAFALTHAVISVVVLTTFISKLTTVMQTMEMIKTKTNRQVSMVRRYCEVHFISTALSLRVRKYVEWKQAVDAKQLHDANENELMQVLPIDLRRALLGETRSPLLSKHMVFLACRESNVRFFQRLCCDVMTPVSHLPDVNIFSYGMLCTRMYFVVAGEASYLKYGAVLRALMTNGSLHQRGRTSVQEAQERYRRIRLLPLQNGAVLCEPVIWTRWVHFGDLSSTTHVNLLALEVERFENLVQSYPPVQMSLLTHAARFVAGLNNQTASELGDMWDTASAFECRC